MHRSHGCGAHSGRHRQRRPPEAVRTYMVYFNFHHLQTKATAARAASDNAIPLWHTFVAAVQKLWLDASFHVNSILDNRSMIARDAFNMTFDKAMGLSAINALRNKPAAEVRTLAFGGLHLNHRTAVVTLVSMSCGWCVALSAAPLFDPRVFSSDPVSLTGSCAVLCMLCHGKQHEGKMQCFLVFYAIVASAHAELSCKEGRSGTKSGALSNRKPHGRTCRSQHKSPCRHYPLRIFTVSRERGAPWLVVLFQTRFAPCPSTRHVLL
jgi:hypothetical protein